MKKILALVVSLTVIAGVCAGVLAYVNSLTSGPIAVMKVEKERSAALAVMPEGVTDVEASSDPDVFMGKDAAGKVVGYAVKGSDPGGYGGDIVLMVGFKADKRTVVCYKALQSSETPGLGTKLSTPEFSGQFCGKDVSKGILVKKDGGEIEAITSATITSRAVCKAVCAAAVKLAAAGK